MDGPSRNRTMDLIRAALAEDVGSGDVTSESIVPESTRASARIVAREALVLAGLEVAERVFHAVDAGIACERHAQEGSGLEAGGVILRVSGPARSILTAERTALNFLQRLSGIATMTREFVRRVDGTGAVILDTRKTTPGWRELEKYAVRCGGGRNHRVGLFDRVLVKDNHLAALRGEKPNPVAAAVNRARASHPDLKVEVEADTLEQVEWAVMAGADVILLDNMSLDDLRRAVALAKGRSELEASGGVTLATIRAIAETGVDFISVGAITHSARAVDMALDFEIAH